jgi:hypothetical protein
MLGDSTKKTHFRDSFSETEDVNKMIVCTLLLLLLVSCVYALDVRFNTHYATFEPMSDTASVTLNLTVDQLFVDVDSDHGGLFGDGAEEILIEPKSVTLRLPLIARDALSTNVSLPFVPTLPSICSFTKWDFTGKGALSSPLKVIPNRVVNLDMTAAWIDRIAFSNFPRPLIGFSVLGYESDSLDPWCGESGGNERYDTTFSDMQLCFVQNSNCALYIGNRSDGWLYWGPRPQYGVHLLPSWTWAGTRRLARPPLNQFIDVPAVPSTSDIAMSSVVNETSCPQFEMGRVELQNGSAMVFHINKDGYLRRSLRVEAITVCAGAAFVLQFDEGLTQVNALTTNIQLKLPTLIRTAGQHGISASVSAPSIGLVNAPGGWEVLDVVFRLSNESDRVSLNVTIGDRQRAMIVTSPSGIVTLPPAPSLCERQSFRCERNCNGHGVCMAENMCNCTTGWVNDPNRGCADTKEVQTQPPATNFISEVVVISPGTTFEESSAGTTSNSSSFGDTTQHGVTVGSTGDQTALIAGYVAAAAIVVLGAVGVCLWFVVKKRLQPSPRPPAAVGRYATTAAEFTAGLDMRGSNYAQMPAGKGPEGHYLTTAAEFTAGLDMKATHYEAMRE